MTSGFVLKAYLLTVVREWRVSQANFSPCVAGQSSKPSHFKATICFVRISRRLEIAISSQLVFVFDWLDECGDLRG
jgi:hypothetical protein